MYRAKQGFLVAGIFYLHRVSDPRVTGTANKNLRLFRELCGANNFPDVALVTTFWRTVDATIATQREKEMRDIFWKDMIQGGSHVARFDGTHDSAWRVLGVLIPKQCKDESARRTDEKAAATLLLPKEIVIQRKRLNETRAGIALSDELRRLKRDQEEANRRLRDEVKSGNRQNKLIVQELEELEKKIDETSSQLKQLKISFLRKIGFRF